MTPGHGYEGTTVTVTTHISGVQILSMDCGDPLPWAPAPTSYMLASGAPGAEAYCNTVHLHPGRSLLVPPRPWFSRELQISGPKPRKWEESCAIWRETPGPGPPPLCSQNLWLTQHLPPMSSSRQEYGRCTSQWPRKLPRTRSQHVLGTAEANLLSSPPHYSPDPAVGVSSRRCVCSGHLSFLPSIFLYFLDFFLMFCESCFSIYLCWVALKCSCKAGMPWAGFLHFVLSLPG